MSLQVRPGSFETSPNPKPQALQNLGSTEHRALAEPLYNDVDIYPEIPIPP